MFALFVDGLVVLLIIIVVTLFIFQVAVPSAMGSVLFPSFRKRVRIAKHQLTELTTEEQIIALEEKVKVYRERLKKAGVFSETSDITSVTIDSGSDSPITIHKESGKEEKQHKKDSVVENIVVDVTEFMKP